MYSYLILVSTYAPDGIVYKKPFVPEKEIPSDQKMPIKQELPAQSKNEGARSRSATVSGVGIMKSIFGFAKKSGQSRSESESASRPSETADKNNEVISEGSHVFKSCALSESNIVENYARPSATGSDASDCTIPDDDAKQARQGAELTAEQIGAFNESTKLMIQHDTAVKARNRKKSAIKDPNNPDAEDKEDDEDDDGETIEGWQMRRVTLIPNLKPAESEESLEKIIAPPVLFRVRFLDDTITIMKMAGDTSMENVLKATCIQGGYAYKDMTFESGEKPNLETIEMDRKLDFYQVPLPKLLELWAMKKSKTYSTVSVLEGETLVLTYQMIDAVYSNF